MHHSLYTLFQFDCMILSQSLVLQMFRVTLYIYHLTMYLNVEINVDVLASVYKK